MVGDGFEGRNNGVVEFTHPDYASLVDPLSVCEEKINIVRSGVDI